MDQASAPKERRSQDVTPPANQLAAFDGGIGVLQTDDTEDSYEDCPPAPRASSPWPATALPPIIAGVGDLPPLVPNGGRPTSPDPIAGELGTTVVSGNRGLRAVTTPAALALLAALVLVSGCLTWQRYHRPCIPASAASSCVGVVPDSVSGPGDNPQPNGQPPAEVGVPAVQPGQPPAPNGQPPVPLGPVGGNGGTGAQVPPAPVEQPGVGTPPAANPAPPVPQVQPPVLQGPPPIPQDQPPVPQGQPPAQQGQQQVPVWGGQGCLFKARDDPSCWTTQTYGPDGHLTPVNTPPSAPAVVTPPQVNAPVVTPPQVSAPVVTPPQVSAPVVTSPQVSAPVVTPPQVSAPVVTSPQVNAPVVTSPQVNAPVVTSPQVNAPVVTSPQVSAPAVVTSPQVSAPVVTSNGGGTTTSQPVMCYGSGAVNCH